MKQYIFSSIKLTVILIIVCVVLYPLVVLGIAQFMPDQGKGERVTDKNGKTYYANIAQKFEADNYFNSRPSAVDYNAAGSGGSNKGPNNPDYLKTVQERVNTFKAKNPVVPVPVDMVTASGSGLDPDISINAAKAQAARISRLRNVSIETVDQLIDSVAIYPILGPDKVNVLKLNIALDKIK